MKDIILEAVIEVGPNLFLANSPATLWIYTPKDDVVSTSKLELLEILPIIPVKTSPMPGLDIPPFGQVLIITPLLGLEM